MLRIRRMRRGDINFAVRLADQEDWGIPTRDFERILRLDPHGSFVAMENEKRVGLATTTSYGTQIAWIGNVVVEESRRGRHIGQALVEHAIGYLERKRVARIALYCFEEHIEFYRKLGFKVGQGFARFRRRGRPALWLSTEPRDRKTMRRSAMLTMDRKAFGANRSRLIVNLLDSGAARYLGYSAGPMRSYILAKDYADMWELGPWVSFGLRRAQMEAMLRVILNTTKSKPIEITCPLTNRRILAMLSRFDFQTMKKGHMMCYKRLSKLGRPKAIVAYGFLDKG
ncbi:MAG: GNAT family N-acetyltransferase [Candidatus Bathyarchaeia archaeon]